MKQQKNTHLKIDAYLILNYFKILIFPIMGNGLSLSVSKLIIAIIRNANKSISTTSAKNKIIDPIIVKITDR